MEIKEILVISLISAIVFVVMGSLNAPTLGGMIEIRQIDFTRGFKVNGTEMVDSSRNLSAGTLSASTVAGTTGTFTGAVSGAEATFTGLDLDFAATSTVQMGATTTPACIVMGDADGGGISFITVTDGVMTVTTTTPTTCEWID